MTKGRAITPLHTVRQTEREDRGKQYVELAKARQAILDYLVEMEKSGAYDVKVSDLESETVATIKKSVAAIGKRNVYVSSHGSKELKLLPRKDTSIPIQDTGLDLNNTYACYIHDSVRKQKKTLDSLVGAQLLLNQLKKRYPLNVANRKKEKTKVLILDGRDGRIWWGPNMSRKEIFKGQGFLWTKKWYEKLHAKYKKKGDFVKRTTYKVILKQIEEKDPNRDKNIAAYKAAGILKKYQSLKALEK